MHTRRPHPILGLCCFKVLVLDRHREVEVINIDPLATVSRRRARRRAPHDLHNRVLEPVDAALPPPEGLGLAPNPLGGVTPADGAELDNPGLRSVERLKGVDNGRGGAQMRWLQHPPPPPPECTLRSRARTPARGLLSGSHGPSGLMALGSTGRRATRPVDA